MSREAQLLRIEKISPNDGMGLRTVVFFKGCPLRCKWCSTPESQKANEELYYQFAKCLSCGTCIDSCSQKALCISKSTGRVVIDPDKCNQCFSCTRVCPSGALGVYGKKMTVEQVMKQILKDEIFYYHSGGGVTLSGGDVLCQAQFAQELLAECKDAGIHTMAELDMYGSYDNVAKLLPLLDEFYVDIKLMDSRLHRQWTGVDNQSVLVNTRKAALACNTLRIRVPLIWGINDTKENILETAEYCRSLKTCKELEFLPYHRLGQSTYEFIGRKYSLEQMPPMTFDEAYERISILKRLKLPFPIKVAGKII